MVTLEKIRDRLKTAEEGGYHLDRDMGLVLGLWKYLPDDHEFCQTWKHYKWLSVDGNIFADSAGSIYDQCYTQSLDAIRDMIRDCYPTGRWSISNLGDRAYASIGFEKTETYIETEAATPELALCLAVIELEIKEINSL